MEPDRPRNVRVRGSRTSLRLEGAFWHALREIAERTGESVPALCERILRSSHRGNRTSAVRVFVLGWFREARAKRMGPRRRAKAA
ncbi:MAG: ribbon-helix-helix domain-containing protein [Rhodospirillales bacterium]|nr:ribbon-helix-helix domain-containing protein [Rhodospirillales bacterium]